MSLFLPAQKLVIATHNSGKLREFAALLDLAGVTCVSAAELNLPEPEETGTTFSANAVLKARAAAEGSGLPALADDSGLCVAALDDAPGIYSARWAGPEKDFRMAMQKIEDSLRAKNTAPTGAKAAFVAVLALALPDGRLIEAEGRTEGTLTFPPRGTDGFGYDPVFVPAHETRSFGEMTMAEKARFSHRARAVAALKQKLA